DLLEPWIDAVHARRHHSYLRVTEVTKVEFMPDAVPGEEEVVVDEDVGADAGTREHCGKWRAESANADDADLLARQRAKLRLPHPTLVFAQQDRPGKRYRVVVTEREEEPLVVEFAAARPFVWVDEADDGGDLSPTPDPAIDLRQSGRLLDRIRRVLLRPTIDGRGVE